MKTLKQVGKFFLVEDDTELVIYHDEEYIKSFPKIAQEEAEITFDEVVNQGILEANNE